MLGEIGTAKVEPNLGQVEAKLINFGTNLEPSWALLGQVGLCWSHVGTRLGQVGAKLVQVEAKLGHLGSSLGPSCAKLGPSWDHVGAKLEPSWAKLEPSWAKLGQVGAKLGLCWQILAGSWQSQRKVTPHVAENHQRWTQRAQHSRQNLDFGRVLGFMLAPKIQ